jgi:hypothetical protein
MKRVVLLVLLACGLAAPVSWGLDSPPRAIVRLRR